MGQTQNKVNQAMQHKSRVVVEHDFNPCTGKAETGGSQEFRGQHGLQELVPGYTPKKQKYPVIKKMQHKKNKGYLNNIMDYAQSGLGTIAHCGGKSWVLRI